MLIHSGARAALRIGWLSACSLLLPAGLLLGAVAALVLAYHHSPAVAQAFLGCGQLKERYGMLYAALLTMVFSGVLPWLLRMALPSLRPAQAGRELVFGLVWWGFMGVCCHLFYQGLSLLYDGHGWPQAGVIAAKVGTDLMFYSAFFAAPANALVHYWKSSGYDGPDLRRALRGDWYTRLVLPNLIPGYLLWIPGLTLVYSMPLELQLFTANLIGSFWAMMCLQIASHGPAPRVPRETELESG